jgi:hypothetical protein
MMRAARSAVVAGAGAAATLGFACGSSSSTSSPVADGAAGGDDAALADATGAADATDAAPLTFDLSADMSFTANPNGPWSYGYSRASTLAGAEVVLDTFVAQAPPGSFWHPGDADAGGAYYPYVAKNTQDASAYGSMMGWSARAGEVTVEGSALNQYGVARFVSPVAGSFALTFHAEGVHFNLSTTDVHVVLNDVDLFRANIDGYGGDPTFHAIEGASPTADFARTITLAIGDVLLFAVGTGDNGTNFNDTTGISVHLVSAS